MNLSQMQTLIYRYGFDANDPVTSVLNGAMHEIETMFDWPFLEVDTTLNVTGSPLTTMNDMAKIIYLKDLTNLRKLTYWDVRKFERDIQDQTLTGNPEVYTIRQAGPNTLIQVWRIPPTSISYDLLYQAITPDMASPNDVPTIAGFYAWPLVMHMPIVYRAAAIMLMMENEEDRAKTAQDQFEKSIMSCMARFGERELDEQDQVDDAQGYMSESYRARGSLW